MTPADARNSVGTDLDGAGEDAPAQHEQQKQQQRPTELDLEAAGITAAGEAGVCFTVTAWLLGLVGQGDMVWGPEREGHLV
jgi:hypothetical protein